VASSAWGCEILSVLLFLLGTRCFGVAITTTSLPSGTVATAYSAVVKTIDGCTPYKWAIVSGALPTGVTAKASSTTTSLNLTGTPTTAATYSFTVKVTGCGGGTSQMAYKVVM
jgi:putative Ig domain-containing protein